MRVRILTVGSYGDVRPYLALARGLIERGHDARLVGPDHYAQFADPAGVPLDGFGPYYDEAETKRVLAATAAVADAKRHPAIGLSLSEASTLAAGARAIELTRDADLIVAHNLSALGPITAEVNKKPLVTGHLFPMLASSRYWLTGRSFGRPLNRAIWSLGSRFVARTTDPIYGKLLEHFGLSARASFFLSSSHSRLLNLVAVSPRVLGRDPIWPAHYECTGYWSLPEHSFQPDPALQAFITAGEPPVVISFGSMFGVDATRLTQLLLEALRASKQRAVLQSGWAGLGKCELPEHVLAVDFVPHAWLFARASLVVHHGGAGTSAAALHAGKPQVMAYHLGDQQFWSRQMQRLGVSAGATANKSLSAAWLAKALLRAREDTKLSSRALALSVALREEQGVANAVSAIEQALTRAEHA